MVYFYYDGRMQYPIESPFNPNTDYPEYHSQIGGEISSSNDVYDAIRNILLANEMDSEHIGMDTWNPLGEYIHPGDCVLLKPNMVVDHNPAEEDAKRGMECAVTHPSVVRCIFDYVYIALQGRGKIILADAPIQGCDFEKMKSASGYDKLFSYTKSRSGENLRILTGDLRSTIFTRRDGTLYQSDNKTQLCGEKIVNLGKKSCFYHHNGNKRLRVTDYDGKETSKHHEGDNNEYCVNSCVLDADVIINLCKPKTHRIAGYTGAMKNMVGINARKEYLPHHTKGAWGHGGDEYLPTHNILKNVNSTLNDVRNGAIRRGWVTLGMTADRLARMIGIHLDHLEDGRKKFGMWYGNDTIWRTIIDLNRIVMYCDKNGLLQEKVQRRIIHFGDMVVSGEKEGPLQPSWKYVGGLLFSDNAVAFDYTLVRLMGFNHEIFPLLGHAMDDNKLFDGNSIFLHSNESKFNRNVDEIEDNFAYIPTNGWKEVLNNGINHENTSVH